MDMLQNADIIIIITIYDGSHTYILYSLCCPFYNIYLSYYTTKTAFIDDNSLGQ